MADLYFLWTILRVLGTEMRDIKTQSIGWLEWNLLYSSNTKIPSFIVKHFLMCSSLTKNWKNHCYYMMSSWFCDNIILWLWQTCLVRTRLYVECVPHIKVPIIVFCLLFVSIFPFSSRHQVVYHHVKLSRKRPFRMWRTSKRHRRRAMWNIRDFLCCHRTILVFVLNSILFETQQIRQ